MEQAIQVAELSREQVELIKASVARGATDLELKLFLYQCKRTGLDPLSRQIHFVKRGDQGTIQTGIDGYRAIADRTGDYAGSEDAVFVEESGHAWPVSATVTVHKLVQGQKCSFTATARWSEYFPSNERQQFFWKKMPYGQLAKCAESLALRKAFPNQLSGVYTNEEMQQAGPEVVQIGDKVVEANTSEAQKAVMDEKLKELKSKEDARKQSKTDTPATNLISEAQVKRLFAIAKSHGWTEADIEAVVLGFGFSKVTIIPKGEKYEKICKFFEESQPTLKTPEPEITDEDIPF